MAYFVMVFFYLVAIFAGRWLYRNRGVATNPKYYTVKKMLPWAMGYVATAFVAIRIHRSSIESCGSAMTYLFYLGFFLMLSLLYRTMMRVVKDFSIYCNDKCVEGTDSFFGWLSMRMQSKILYKEFYEVDKIAFDVDLAGYFGAAVLLMTVCAMFYIL
jgi:hypothetical protein